MITTILSAAITLLVLITIDSKMTIVDLKKELKKAELNRDYYEWCYQTACSEINRLRYQSPTQSSQQAKTTTNQDIVDAVKYAMKMSHPDNNGNAEDFVKFRKLYKELTK